MTTTTRSNRDTQYDELLRDVACLTEKLGQSFQDFRESTRRELVGHGEDIRRMTSSFDSVERRYAQRFHALAGREARGDPYNGPFASREEARHFGLLCIAAIDRGDAGRAALLELQKAGIKPDPGAAGGYLTPDLLLPGIIRNVEQYGVFERNVPPILVPAQSGRLTKRTGGLTVYHPELEAAPTASSMTFGAITFTLTRYATLTLCDRWMMADQLAVALGDFVALEIGQAVAYAQDLYAFTGDGTSTYARITGAFQKAGTGQLVVTSDVGDDIYSEVIAKSTYYLGQVMGQLPGWAHVAGPRWYMHLSMFFGYLSVRDTAGMPIANILQADRPNPFLLMGYPVEITQVAPQYSTTGTTGTVMLIFGALARGFALLRHILGFEIRTSEHYKFAEGQVAIAGDVLQDIVETDNQAYVQLKTGAAS